MRTAFENCIAVTNRSTNFLKFLYHFHDFLMFRVRDHHRILFCRDFVEGIRL